MKRTERLSLLHKVATLSYEANLPNYEIAVEVHQSPTQVGLLLKEAIKEGIVTIKITMPRFSVLRDKLIQRFNLRDAVVIPSDTETSALMRNLGRAAAEYFDKSVTPNSRVALGSGYVIYRMIDELEDEVRKIDIYPTALVGRGPTITHIDPVALVTLLWAKCGRQSGRAHYVTLTPPRDSATIDEVRRHYTGLESNPKVLNLLKDIKRADHVFTSIGGLNADADYITASNKTSQNLFGELKLSREALLEEGAVGDIAYSFYNSRGVTKPKWSIFPGLKIADLQRMARTKDKKVVVIAGRYKSESLRAILEGRFCNVLITDVEAAEAVLKAD